MSSVSYSTLIDNIQANLYAILSVDATIKPYAEKIIDGIGVFNERLTGHGRVLIRAPLRKETKLTMGDKIRVDVTTEIQCICYQESQVRKLVDAVINALRTSQYAAVNSTLSWGMHWKNIDSTELKETPLDNNRVEYEIDIIVSYTVNAA